MSNALEVLREGVRTATRRVKLERHKRIAEGAPLCLTPSGSGPAPDAEERGLVKNEWIWRRVNGEVHELAGASFGVGGGIEREHFSFWGRRFGGVKIRHRKSGGWIRLQGLVPEGALSHGRAR